METLLTLNKNTVIEILRGSYEKNDLTQEEWMELKKLLHSELEMAIFKTLDVLVPKR
jgi:hypothetical protein